MQTCLYKFYTSDISPLPPWSHTNNISYVDITQIISHAFYPSYCTLATQRANKHINTFEKHWKIKTNTNKFQIIPIDRNNYSRYINNIPNTRKGKVLRLEFGCSSY